MNKGLVAGALAVVAVFAGVVYFARDAAKEPAGPIDVAKQAALPAQEVRPTAMPTAPRGGAPAQRPAPPDPRLALLMVSPDDSLIEFVADPEGRVIKEVDNDAASPSYRKPLREYTYAGTRVVRLVKYQYGGEQTQIVTADVIYRLDGAVGDYRETTRYEDAQPGRAGAGLPR